MKTIIEWLTDENRWTFGEDLQTGCSWKNWGYYHNKLNFWQTLSIIKICDSPCIDTSEMSRLITKIYSIVFRPISMLKKARSTNIDHDNYILSMILSLNSRLTYDWGLRELTSHCWSKKSSGCPRNSPLTSTLEPISLLFDDLHHTSSEFIVSQ